MVSEKHVIGFCDLPSNVDSFGIENYIEGLARFVLNCETPLVVAIQGDWGTGKSSIMEMVVRKIKETDERGFVVFFNTWQFSQFNLGDQLPIIMLQHLTQMIAGKDGDTLETAKKIGSALLKISSSAIKKLTNGVLDIRDVIPAGENKADLVEQIKNLKDNFQSLIDQRAGSEGRVIIFVDDLDRLEPARAVEVLEVLKVFCDCKKCVFILALDYDVVVLGVKSKYGDDFDSSKAKSFFDKIIQVPFRMPVQKYKIERFVGQYLQKMGFSVESDNTDLQTYVKFIRHSVGNNPRSMKRLFNSFQLLGYISPLAFGSRDGGPSENGNVRKLFALLCMQASFDKIYNHILENSKVLSADLFKNLKDEDFQLYKELFSDRDEIRRCALFFNDFYDLLDDNDDGSVSEDELRSFAEILDYSSITSSSNSAAMNLDDFLDSIDSLFD